MDMRKLRVIQCSQKVMCRELLLTRPRLNSGFSAKRSSLVGGCARFTLNRLHYTYTMSHITHVPSKLALTASVFELDICMQETGPLCSCRTPCSFWYVDVIFQTRTWIQIQKGSEVSLLLVSV
jgi:hypothetical protein